MNPSPDRLPVVTAEMDHLLYALRDVATIPPGPVLPAWFLSTLAQRWDMRYRLLHAEWLALTGQDAPPVAGAAPTGQVAPPAAGARPPLGATPLPATVPPPGSRTAPQEQVTGARPSVTGRATTPAAPAGAAPREPWLRNFAADNAVLLLGHVGGFLLVIATLLFELYGAAQFGDTARFAGVLGITAAVGALAHSAHRHQPLRVLAPSYTALFALLVPLTAAAARLLLLHDAVPVAAAFVAGGAGCAALYALLARSLRSEGYALLTAAAVAAAWGGIVDLLHPGAGTPAVVAALALAPACLRRARWAVGGFAADTLRAGSAGLALAWLAWDLDATGGARSVVLPLTLGILLAAQAIPAVLLRRAGDIAAAAVLSTATVLGAVFATGGGWDAEGGALVALGLIAIAAGVAGRRDGLQAVGVLHVVAAAWLPLSSGLPVGLALVAAAATGLALALLRHDARPLAVGAAALGGPLLYLLSDGTGAGGAYPLGFLTTSLVALTAATAIYAAGRRDARMLPWLALALKSSGLSAVVTFGLPEVLVPLQLVVEAAGWALVADRVTLRPTAGRLRAIVFLGLLGTAVSVTGTAAAEAAMLAAATLVAAVVAVQDRRPDWLYAAGGLGAWAWYWAGAALLPASTDAGADTLVRLFIPVPVLLTAVAGALVLVRRDGRSWATPLLATAAVVAAASAVLVGQSDATLLAVLLLIDAPLVAAGSAMVRRPEGMVGVVVLQAGGVLSALVAAGAALGTIPVVLAGVSWVAFTVGAMLDGAWRRVLQLSALALAGATAAGCVLDPDFLQAGDPASLGALLAGVSLAAMLQAFAMAGGPRQLGWLAAGVLAVAADWMPVHLGATNTQAYVVIPALAALALGLHVDRPGAGSADREVATTLLGAGTVALTALSALQMLADVNTAGGYAALLVAEGSAALCLAIATRRRAVALTGGAAVAVAGLRALYVVSEGQPLYVVFAALALLLLGGAATLALVRDEATRARESLRQAWSEWR